jgi:Uncharacterised nucleotidyltransferase
MSYTPAERNLILLSAGTAARREALRDRIGRPAAAAVDWQQLTEILRLRRLLPVLGPRILELADGSAGPDFAAAVEEGLEAGRRQAALLQLVSMRTIGMLAEAGIRAAPLKGPQLSEAIHGDPGRRLSSDIDLLVAADQLEAAVEVVRELGYETPTDPLEPSGLPQLHFALIHARGELPPVELHWRIHWYEESFARERLLPPAADPEGAWRPERAAELASLLLYYARDGFIDLRLPADISAWWDAFGDDLPAGALDRLLLSHPELAPAIQVALATAEAVVGIPAQVIASTPPLRPRHRIAARLANPNPHSSRAQLYAERGLIDGLLTPPGGLRAFVRRQVLPPRDVLEQQARHGEREQRRTSLGRGAGVLGRYGLAFTRLLRPSETLA